MNRKPTDPQPTAEITEAAVEGDPAVRRALWAELVAAQQNNDQRGALIVLAEALLPPGEPATVTSVNAAQDELALAVWLGGVPPPAGAFRLPEDWAARLSRPPALLSRRRAACPLRPGVFQARWRGAHLGPGPTPGPGEEK